MIWKMFLQSSFQKCRSSHFQMFFKTGALINFLIFTRNYVLKSLFNTEASRLATSCKVFYASSDIWLTWRKPFSNQKMKLYMAQIITCDVWNLQSTGFCSIICKFSIFLCCFQQWQCNICRIQFNMPWKFGFLLKLIVKLIQIYQVLNVWKSKEVWAWSLSQFYSKKKTVSKSH